MGRDRVMVKSSAYRSLERKPGGPDNWVEQVKGLPNYIERIAKHLHYERGFSIQHAIATAVNTVKRWARMGKVAKYGDPHNKHVTAKTAAQAAKAVAEWEAKKALARALPGTPRGGRMGRRRSVGLSEAMLDVLALAERANAIRDPQAKADARGKILELAVFSAAQRRHLAGTGAAMGGGSFPIRNEQDLRNAIRALGRAKNPAAAKRHIIQRARSLGLMSVLPESWRTVSMSVEQIDLARRGRKMTSDGRPSFKGNGGKYRHGFIPKNEAAVTAKAKGSPIAKKRIHRLYGSGGASDTPKRQVFVRSGGGSVSAGRLAHARGVAVGTPPGRGRGPRIRNTAQDDTSSPVTAKTLAQRPWSAIDDADKVIRNGQKYVKMTFNGQTKLVPWRGPQGPEVEAGGNNRIAAISQRDVENLDTATIRKNLRKPGATSRAARKNLNAGLRKAQKARKRT